MHESNSSLTLHNNRARRLSTSSRRCFESASHHSSVATSNAPVHPLDPPYLSWPRHHGHRRRSRVSSTLSATVSQPNTHCSAPGIVGRALHHGSSKFLLRPPSFTSFRGSFRGPFAMAPPVDGPAIELAAIDGVQHHALSAQHTHTQLCSARVSSDAGHCLGVHSPPRPHALSIVLSNHTRCHRRNNPFPQVCLWPPR